MPGKARHPPLTLAFAAAAGIYWGRVFPLARRELARWRREADRIPDPTLRQLAIESLAKRSNMEGAAAFATFVPAKHRSAVVRAAVAFQSAYNYLDLVSEQPAAEAISRSRALHKTLPAALQLASVCSGSGLDGRVPSLAATAEGRHVRVVGGDGRMAACEAARSQADVHDGGLQAGLGPARSQADVHDGGPRAAHADGQDRSYLQALVRECRQATASLPGYGAVEPSAVRAAERIVDFQAFNCGAGQGDGEALRSWAESETPEGSGLTWWETAGAAGSSLGVFAMLAVAARSAAPSEAEIATVEDLCFPWAGALHSLLDQMVDLEEDERTGQLNLFCCYRSRREAGERLGWLAANARARARALGQSDLLMVTAMAAMYLAAPASGPEGEGLSREAVRRELGPLVWPAIAVFRATGRATGGATGRATGS